MKKLLIVVAVLMVAVVALGVAGFAYAQSQNPTNPNYPNGAYGPGMMGGRGMMGGARGGQGGYGMMGGRGMMGGAQGMQGAYGPMHSYMVEGWAEAFGLTVEELDARLADGDTMWTIAEEQGLTQEQFNDLMVEIRTDALNAMVADEVITQEQADAMIARMAQMHANGYGPGSGACGGMGGGRWNQTAPQQPVN